MAEPQDTQQRLLEHDLSVMKWERRLLYRVCRNAYFEGTGPIPDVVFELNRRSREIHAVEVELSRL